MKLNELLELFLRSRVLRPKSVDNYRAVCRRFVTFLGEDPPLETITRDRLIQYRDHVLQRASPATFNNYRRHLSVIFSYAVIDIDELSENPWRRVRGVRAPTILPKTVDTDDLQQALNVFRKHVLNIWGEEAGKKWSDFWNTLVRMLYFTGMRRAQIVGLEWRDIKFKDDTIRIRPEIGKTQIEWTIPLLDQVRDDIVAFHQSVEDYLGQAPADRAKVFDPKPFSPSSRLKMDHPLTVGRLSAFFTKLSKKTGTRISPHRIRHTTCSTIVNKGKNLKAAQEILGHTDVKITLKYVHPDMDDLRRAGDSLQLPRPDESPDQPDA